MFFSGINGFGVGQTRGEFATDFTEYATGTALTSAANWSRQDHIGTTTNTISTDTTSPTGMSLAMSVSGTAGDTFGYTKPPSASALTDVNVLTLWKVTTTPDSVGGAGPVIRLGNTGQNGYNCVPLVSSGNKIEQAEFLAQNRTGNIGGQVAVAWDTTNWWWTRIEASGTTIRSRVWQFGTAEPTSWNVTGTDASYSSGYVGLMSRPNVALKFAFFSVATGGNVAPGLSG